MPVPVPKASKPSAHRVVKSTSQAQGYRHASAAAFVRNDAFKYVIHDACRQSATGAPRHPYREDHFEFSSLWITHPSPLTPRTNDNDCPAVNRHERLVPGDVAPQNGLTVAESAAGNKQRRAEACHSPVRITHTASNHHDMGLQSYDERRRSSDGVWPCLDPVNVACQASFVGAQYIHIPESAQQGNLILECRDMSGMVSSDDSSFRGHPSDTPFADYVDRAVAMDMNCRGHFEVESHKTLPLVETPRRQQPPTTEPLTDAAYIKTYRDLSESLSEWFADYVWKVCTQGLSLRPDFVTARPVNRFPEKAPASLARSVRSVLCSTLLQPSAIVLALWYIARLPVFFEWQPCDEGQQEFRDELLRLDPSTMTGDERDNLEFQVPFRLIVLGCMLANKWLDDHTFSNKTWHTISEIPARSINRLELLALALFKQDLSIPSQAWEQWLSHLRQYHLILSPFPSPIRRPSATDSNVLIRKFIDDLTMLLGKTDNKTGSSPPQPVFSPLLNSDTETVHVNDSTLVGSYEIDLDEDGPLREEYIPRRRTSQSRSISSFQCVPESRPSALVPQLPPPSEWSPQADPPIGEIRGRRDMCLPVQPLYVSMGQTSHTRSFSMETTVRPSVWGPFKSKEMHETYRPPGFQPFTFHSSLSMAHPPISYTRSTLSPLSTLANNSGDLRPRSHFFADEGNTTTVTCGQHFGYPPAFAHAHGDPTHFKPLWLQT